MAIFYLSGDFSTGPKNDFLLLCVFVFTGHHFYIQAKLVIKLG